MKEKEIQITKLLEENYYLKNELKEVTDLLALTTNESSDQKLLIFKHDQKTKKLLREFEKEKLQLCGNYEKKLSETEQKTLGIKKDFKKYREYMELEELAHHGVRDKVIKEMNKFKKSTHTMRSILRVPRLTKAFHDLLADPKVKD